MRLGALAVLLIVACRPSHHTATTGKGAVCLRGGVSMVAIQPVAIPRGRARALSVVADLGEGRWMPAGGSDGRRRMTTENDDEQHATPERER